MARRGDTARENVTERIKEAFGADFVGIQDKKIYVQAKENGEKIQFAISLTMPKTPIGATENPNDWRPKTEPKTEDSSVVVTSDKPATLSPEDEATIAKLMKDLGIEDN